MQMVFSEYIKLQIVYHHNNGLKPYIIAKMLLEREGIAVSKAGVWKFLKMYKETGSTGRRAGSGRVSKDTQRVKDLVNQQMEDDDETTATQLHRRLVENGTDISLRTILRYVSTNILNFLCLYRYVPATYRFKANIVLIAFLYAYM